MHGIAPFHPLMIAVENGERTYTWDCPADCASRLDCNTINEIRYNIHNLGDLPCGEYRVAAHQYGMLFTLPNGDTVPALTGTPSGCQHCGITEREHMQRWITGTGWHAWQKPTISQIKLRMLARRQSRKAAA